MALIKKQLLAKEDMLLSADNTPVSQARAGTIISVHPINASVIPFDENRSIAEAIQGVTYTHPLTHPVSIIDGSSNPSKFVKTDSLGNTGFDTVAWADIEGKPSTYTPSSHEHSLDEVTSGSLAASRVAISETRQFITAEQASQLLDMEVKSNKGMPNGYAPLDSNGKINQSFLSALNLVEVFTPTDLASMLALTSAQPGDIAYRQDNSTSYMLAALPSSTEANWKSLNTGSQIISVNGQTGIVSLNTSDIAERTNLYFTNERVDDRVANLLQAGTNISLAYDDTSNTLTINANDTSVDWSEVQSKPTTISGYGITDAYTKTETNSALSLKAPLASPTFTGTVALPSTTSIGNVSSTELGYLDGVTSSIQTQFNGKVSKTGNETIAGVKTLTDGLKLQGQNVSPFSGFKNYIINGNFDVWQRGTSHTTNNGIKYGSADRWRTVNLDATNLVCTQQTVSGVVPFQAKYFMRQTVPLNTSNGTVLDQCIEGLRQFSNKTITLSLWVNGTAGKKIGLGFNAVYGTGGTPTVEENIKGSVYILSGGWEKISITKTLPDFINGKTYGTYENDYFRVLIYTQSSSTNISPEIFYQSGTFDIAQVQLEEGSVATPFENRPYGLELLLCRRYYQAGGGFVTLFSGNVTNGVLYSNKIYLPVNMRTTPTVVLTDAGGNSNFQATSGAVFSNTTCIREDRVASGTGSGTFQSTFTASAEL